MASHPRPETRGPRHRGGDSIGAARRQGGTRGIPTGGRASRTATFRRYSKPRRVVAAMIGYFIDRPVFAWVLAIVIMLMGGLAITALPISQYPSIAPPALSLQVMYPGASADTVQSAVTQVM